MFSRRDCLPIDNYRDKILDLVEKNEVTIITSSTGSGKTTRVPQFLLSVAVPGSFIVATQPRRIAAISAARRVSKECGYMIGEHEVGFKISMDEECSRLTRITYVTTGILIEMLITQKTKCKYNYIVIDEVHTRDIFTDELLLQVKLLQLKYPFWKPKIILMSATMNVHLLMRYFDHKTVGVLEVEKSIQVNPLTTYFIDHLKKGTVDGISANFLKDPNIKNGCSVNFSNVKHLISQLWKIDKRFGSKGGVLVFLPGLCEIVAMEDMLRSHCERSSEKWIVVPMHSNLPDDEMEAAFFPVTGNNERKVVLSTNISESSLTIPDIRYVIDLCFTKINKLDVETGFSSLVVQLSSRHQSQQRAGRVGRVGEGFCFRLCTIEFWNYGMDESSPSELQTGSIDFVYLHMKKLDLGVPSQMLLQAISPPVEENIISTVKYLKLNGALTILNRKGDYVEEDGEITIIGNLASVLCIDSKLARVVYFGRLFGLLNESIVIACALSCKPIFAAFSDDRYWSVIHAFIRKLEFGCGLNSDALCNLGAYHYYLKSQQRMTYEEEYNWLDDMKLNFIKSASLKDLEYNVKRAQRKLSSYFNLKISSKLKTVDEIANDPDNLLCFQLMMAFSSYPNIYHHFRASDQSSLVKLVTDAYGSSEYSTCMILGVDSAANEPDSEQLHQIERQLNFSFDSEVDLSPLVFWNQTQCSLTAQYFPEPFDPDYWIGDFPKEIYKALKFKACGQNCEMTIRRETIDGNKQVVKLIGPKTHLELRFMSFTHNNFQETIYLDRESANQFILDSQFPLPNSLSIASMRLSRAKKHIVAKDSTLLPSNLGLIGIIHLLLSQRIQIKMSDEEERVLEKCIVGLGNIPNTIQPISSGTDQTLYFDYRFEWDDLHAANRLRKQLNNVFKQEVFTSESVSNSYRRMDFVKNLLCFVRKERVNKEFLGDGERIKWKQDTEIYDYDDMFPEIKFSQLL